MTNKAATKPGDANLRHDAEPAPPDQTPEAAITGAEGGGPTPEPTAPGVSTFSGAAPRGGSAEASMGPEESAGPANAQSSAPAAVPTREDIRAMVKERIASGSITIEDVMIDMYASQYAIELHLAAFREQMEDFRSSRLGRVVLRRARKEMDHADEER